MKPRIRESLSVKKRTSSKFVVVASSLFYEESSSFPELQKLSADGQIRESNSVSLEFLAEMYAEYIEREIQEATRRKLPTKAKKIIRIQSRRSMIERWDTHLFNPRTADRRTVEVVRLCLSEWMDRGYHIPVDVGADGMFRKGRERTTACHHCDIL